MRRQTSDKLVGLRAILVALTYIWLNVGLVVLPSYVEATTEVYHDQQDVRVNSAELRKAIQESINRVDEFLFIRSEAKKLGVKVYLFGGTAAAFAHYVKWDLLRKKGDSRFNSDRFDYRYINIYRSTQDLDIVVDGSFEAIGHLEQSLKDHYPYLQGSKGAKSSWEVRSLRQSHGTKIALLANPDFLNQHTDSQSVGLINLTEDDSEAELVRDLRDWDNLVEPQFLRDVVDGKIHFYFSQLHESTKFYREGRNPPIVAVIRYFIKVFQLDLEMREEEKAAIQSVIDSFDPNSILNNDYLRTWFENNAPKLIQNAIDVETAVRVLTETGLRKKLSQIGSIQTEHSVAWWMDKQPLLSSPLGQNGRTALDLGITNVAHETRSFLVYEAITRSHKGLPNILISRRGKVGETAAFGDGLYTIPGQRSGFVGSGFTIRFKVDPNAREGIDFKLVNGGQYVLFLNRSTLKVIPESLQLDLIGYYSMLLSTKEVSKDDLGVFHRLRLALRARFLEPHQEELAFLNSLSARVLLSLVSKDSTIEGTLLLLRIMHKKDLASQDIVDLANAVDGLRVSRQFVQKNQKEIYEKFYNEFREEWLQRFLSQSPNVTQCKKALEVGLFRGNEGQYLKVLYPTLKNVDDITPALKHWRTWSRTQSISRESRYWIIKIGHLFYSMFPNENHVDEFNKTIVDLTKTMPLGLAAVYFEDPLVLALAIQKATTQKAIPLESILRVWQRQKEKFFGFGSSAADFTAYVQQMTLAEIQLDILERAIAKRLFLRRSDLIKFVNSLMPRDSLTSAERMRADDLLRKMTEVFFSMNPSMPEVSSYFGSPVIGESVQLMMLNYKNFAIASEDELFKFLNAVGNTKKANDLFLRNPNWLQEYPINAFKVGEILKLLDYGEASAFILETAFEQHNDNTEQILAWLSTPIRQWAHKYPDIFDLAWSHCFANAGFSGKNRGLMGSLLKAIPTAKSYRQFLETYLQKIQVLDDYQSVPKMNQSWGSSQTYFTSSDLEQILKVNDELIPQAVEQALLSRTSRSSPRRPISIGVYSELASHLGSPEATIHLLSLFLKYGAFDESYINPDLAWNSKFYKESKIEEIRFSLLEYFVTHANEFTSKQNEFTMNFYATTLRRVLSSEQLLIEKFHGDKELISAIIRFYMLAAIKNRKNGLRAEDLRDGTKYRFDHYFGSNNLTDGRIKIIFDQLKQDMNHRYSLMLADTSGSKGNGWNPLSRVINATADFFSRDGLGSLEAQMERELAAAHVTLTERVRYLSLAATEPSTGPTILPSGCKQALTKISN